MARRAITQDLYTKLVEGFLKFGEVFTKVGGYAGVDARTATIAWRKGFNKKGENFGPIKLVIQTKQAEARIARQETAEKALIEQEARLKKLQEDAIKTESEEYEMTAQLRHWLTIHAKGIIGPLNVLATAQVNDLIAQHQAGTLKMSNHEKMDFIRMVTLLDKYSGEAHRLSLENERLRLGQPTAVLGLQMDTITPEEAGETLAKLLEEFQDGKPLASEVIESLKGGSLH